MEEEEKNQPTQIVGLTISDDAWYSPLTRSMYDMAKNGQLCDTEITSAEGIILFAHSTVLASRSNILKETFLATACSKYKITTEEISARSWNCLLEFMYLGTVDIEPQQLKDIMQSADILEMDALKDNCSSALDMQRQMGTLSENENKCDQETQIEPEIMKFAAGMSETLQFISTLEDNTDDNGDNTDYGMHADNTQEGNEAVYYMVQDQNESESSVSEIKENSEATSSVNQTFVGTEIPLEVQAVSEASSSVKDEVDGDHSTGYAVLNKTPAGLLPSTSPARILPLPRGRPRYKNGKDNPLLKCSVCNKVYASKQSLERHLFLHSNVNAYTCDQCGKSFKTDRYLIAHIQRHNEVRSFQCPICGKSFKTQRDANWHKKTVHSSVRAFSCQYCPYSTKTRALLNQHMLSHTSSKEYACKTCGKTFLRKQHLEQHATRHEGKRQYMCSSCGAEFYTIYACKEHHMRVHQGIKRYECSVCHQQYNEKKSFMKHLQKHSVDLVLKLEGGDIVIEQTVEEAVA